MKRFKKKALALLLTTAMIVGLAPAAFAGTFSDVAADASYAAAVDRLAGLGVVQGMGGGVYEPNGTFTRAQAAAIAVRLRGIKTAGAGATDFKDVAADHWASGWINMAVGLGIVQGMGDGTFAPDAPVTHAQWMTMVLRVMGYEPAIKNKPWPAGALAQAALLGLDSGVNVVPNLPANRAEVATIADNSLTKTLMVLSGVDANGKETYSNTDATKTISATYLKNSLDPTSGTSMLVKSPELLSETKVDNADGTAGAADITSGSNYTGLLGHEAVLWKNSDGKVFFIEDKTAASNVKTMKVGSSLTIDSTTVTDTSLVTGGVQVFKNSLAVTAKPATAANLLTAVNTTDGAADNGEATAIMKDGKISAVIVNSSTTAVVSSASTAFESITTDSGSLSVKDVNVVWKGAASKLADVQKGDVIEYYPSTAYTADGKKYQTIVVTRNAKTGDLSKADVDTGSAGGKATIGGTEYTYNVADSSVTALLSKSVKATLNKHGKIVKIESATSEAAKTIAALYGDPWNTTGSSPTLDNQVKVRVIKSDGTEAIYVVAKGATVGSITDFNPVTNAASGLVTQAVYGATGANKSVIEFTTNSSGEINSITVLYNKNMTAATVTAVKDTNTATGGGVSDVLAVPTNTAIFTVDTDKPGVVSRDQLMGDGSVTGILVRTSSTEYAAKALAITTGLSAGSADTYGLHVGEYQTSDKKFFTVNVKGTAKDYEVDSLGGAAADDVVKFNATDSKTTMAAVTAVANTSSKVWKVKAIDTTNKIVTVAEYDSTSGAELSDSQKGYLVNDKTQVFNLNGDNAASYAGFGDLVVGQTVNLYDPVKADGTSGQDYVLEVVTIK